MSRTDAHTPYWVKMRAAGWRKYVREVHDHETGVCDLDVWLAHQSPGTTWEKTHCYMEGIFHDGEMRCGCRLCTNYWGRKWTRQRIRKQMRQALRSGNWDRRPELEKESWGWYGNGAVVVNRKRRQELEAGRLQELENGVDSPPGGGVA
jgi:hypothetical protein